MGFWTDKRVTVTGGSGFLGTPLVERFEDAGAKVFVPRSRDYDLRSVEQAHRMYRDASPEILIHLAAQVGGIRANQENPGRFFYDNMAMGMNVVEGARHYGALTKLVFVGTTCSYPKFTAVPFTENDLWNGYPEETNAPYGIAKRAMLAMAWGYREQYGLNTIYLIPANLYGPRDNFDLETGHVIPALIRKFAEAKNRDESSVLAWGTGQASREFLYVEDAADAIVGAAELYGMAEPVNLGTGHEVQIAELVELIAEQLSFGGEIVWDSTKPDGQPRRRLDTGRALAEFGFQAQTSLRQGLIATIDWYLKEW